MKSGFSLLEISIVLMISAIMSLSLYKILKQTKRGVLVINDIIDTNIPLAALYNQLEKDVTGAFIPKSTEDFYRKKAQESSANDKNGTKNNDKNSKEALKNIDRPTSEGSNKEKLDVETKDNSPKHIEKIFFVDYKNQEMLWSFITTNSIARLGIDQAKKVVTEPKASIARVAYQLKKDPTQEGLFNLFYKYSLDNLELEPIQADNFEASYKLLSNIKKFDLSFTVYKLVEVTEKDLLEKKKATSKAEPIKENWEESSIFEKYKALIPAYVSIIGSVQDRDGAEHDFRYDFQVYGYHNILTPNSNRPSRPTQQPK